MLKVLVLVSSTSGKDFSIGFLGNRMKYKTPERLVPNSLFFPLITFSFCDYSTLGEQNDGNGSNFLTFLMDI